MPKAIPNFIKSAKIIGERGSGSIKKIILVDAKLNLQYVSYILVIMLLN